MVPFGHVKLEVGSFIKVMIHICLYIWKVYARRNHLGFIDM